jgi:hypothetical protein
MKGTLATMLVVVAGLLAANMLGVASAEGPTTTASPRTVSVQGVAKAPLAQGASTALATESYRQAMASAIADGLGKAEFLAAKAGVALGAAQSVVENGGSISCTAGPEAEYLAYEGEQPDFPMNDAVAVAPRAFAPAVRNSKPRVKRHKAKTKAKKATAAGCAVSAQVSLVYAIS